MTHDITTNVVYTPPRLQLVKLFFDSLRMKNIELKRSDTSRIIVTLSDKDMLIIQLRYDDIRTHLDAYVKENVRKLYNLQLSERFNLFSVLERSDDA